MDPAKFVCPLLQKPCTSTACAWWGRKEKNCAARILARLPNFEIDPLDAVLMGGGKKNDPEA
jgi:hypothetical protein